MIGIIGGGVAGLVAAINLENANHECLIVEQKSYIGGRVATDNIDGMALDRGFQVLLTDYPFASKYLDYNELELSYFQPGAVVFKNGKRSKFGDPLRDLLALWPTMISWVGNFQDKLKVYKLSKELSLKQIKAIFESSDKTTMKYLQEYGFSERIISNFFKPFFGGIFLESELNTSSRMFEFVFKMFSNGSAAIPKHGMNAIPLQLKDQLKRTKFALHSEAKITEDGQFLVNGRPFKVDGIIKAYAEKVEWHGCSTYYYKVDQDILKEKIIGLIADKDSIVNSFYYVRDDVISVTTLHTGDPKNIDLQIRMYLKEQLGLEVIDFIQKYNVPRSLPVLQQLTQSDKSQCVMMGATPVAHAGDYLNYPSLNAAMFSGEKAANALIDELASVTSA